ncbi:hypothetical protein Angca_001601, partial [Angiostrongylus cantonensis]
RLPTLKSLPLYSLLATSKRQAASLMNILYSVCFKNHERVEEERWTRGCRPASEHVRFVP